MTNQCLGSVLVTGASRGLGKALAEQLSTITKELYLIVRQPSDAQSIAQQIPNAHVFSKDITDSDYEAQLEQWLGNVELNIVINNAGIGSKGHTIDTATAEQVKRVLMTNCLGSFKTIQATLPALRRAKQGLVLNISSRRGSLQMQASGAAKGSGCSYSYRISKAALNMFTLCLADDLENEMITVAAVHPGRLQTNMASNDANLTPELAADRIIERMLNHAFEHRQFYSVEGETLPW